MRTVVSAGAVGPATETQPGAISRSRPSRATVVCVAAFGAALVHVAQTRAHDSWFSGGHTRSFHASVSSSAPVTRARPRCPRTEASPAPGSTPASSSSHARRTRRTRMMHRQTTARKPAEAVGERQAVSPATRSPRQVGRTDHDTRADEQQPARQADRRERSRSTNSRGCRPRADVGGDRQRHRDDARDERRPRDVGDAQVEHHHREHDAAHRARIAFGRCHTVERVDSAIRLSAAYHQHRQHTVLAVVAEHLRDATDDRGRYPVQDHADDRPSGLRPVERGSGRRRRTRPTSAAPAAPRSTRTRACRPTDTCPDT